MAAGRSTKNFPHLYSDPIGFLRHVQERKGMYGLKTYSDFCSFLIGADYGLNGTLLSGFMHWVPIRTDTPRNWGFMGVVRAYLQDPDPFGVMEGEECEYAIDTLVGLIEEFFQSVDARDRHAFAQALHHQELGRRRSCMCCGFDAFLFARNRFEEETCQYCGWEDSPVLLIECGVQSSDRLAELTKAREVFDMTESRNSEIRFRRIPRLDFSLLTDKTNKWLLTGLPIKPESLQNAHFWARLRYLNLLWEAILVPVQCGRQEMPFDLNPLAELRALKTRLARADDSPKSDQSIEWIHMIRFAELMQAAWNSVKPTFGLFGWQPAKSAL